MRNHKLTVTLFALLVNLGLMPSPVSACSSLLVSRGASTDGSVMTSWTYDVAGFALPLPYYKGGVHQQGDSLEVFSFREGVFLGRIAQAPRTYKVVGNMNEHQVSIGETTFGGRSELGGGNGFLDYGNLIWITLQRATSAIEAIKILTGLANTYGYSDSGETLFFADKNEVWIMDFIGKGKHGKGAVWVAARVPDGYVAAHANQSRIRKVNWGDSQNWLWADDVVDFARQMGWFQGSKEDFSFREAYNPPDCRSLLLCESRVWSFYRRIAPSQNFSSDYWRCHEGAEAYPLFIKPDQKVSLDKMIGLLRDHFDQTPYYTRSGIEAGPYQTPYMNRPMTFKLDENGESVQYSWNRPISQPQTAFSFVTQARSWLPNSIGGICWYSLDDNYTNVFIPLYMGVTRSPVSLSIASSIEFDWNSAYWVFNKVSNHAYPIFKHVISDIQEAQKELENRAIAMTTVVDKAAAQLGKDNPEFMQEYITDFSVSMAETIVERWRQLGFKLFVKFNDGYTRGTNSIKEWPKGLDYPEDFKRRIIKERPGFFDAKMRGPRIKD